MARVSFGQYEVLARLASGGAANIFLAREVGRTPQLLALKTLLPERARDEEFVQMFWDEARLAQELKHPNCVRIFKLDRQGPTHFISMEFILGHTLWDLLATVAKVRIPLPPGMVAQLLVNICDGLHHAHDLCDPTGRPYNLVHRDVSPQNVMVNYEGHVKVLDFGIAKAETGRAATATGIVKGKFSYMSPEQITGGAIDRRSDIYSLGIILYECLASRRLYRADTPEEIARMMIQRTTPRVKDVVPGLPAQLDAITTRALGRRPEQRYQTAAEMAEDLRNFLDEARLNIGRPGIRSLMQERFGDRIPAAEQMYGQALDGSYDEAELFRVFKARPVMMVDLFPTGGDAEEQISVDDDDDVDATSEQMPPSGTPSGVKILSASSPGRDVRAGPPGDRRKIEDLAGDPSSEARTQFDPDLAVESVATTFDPRLQARSGGSLNRAPGPVAHEPSTIDFMPPPMSPPVVAGAPLVGQVVMGVAASAEPRNRPPGAGGEIALGSTLIGTPETSEKSVVGLRSAQFSLGVLLTATLMGFAGGFLVGVLVALR